MATDKTARHMPREILRLVRRYPGLHLREVARQLRTSVARIEYHVPAMVEGGHLDVVPDARHRRLFATEDTVQREQIVALRDGRRLHVALALLHGAATHSALAKRTGMGKSTLSFHLRRLEAAGLLVRDGSEYHLTSQSTVAAMIAKYQPPPGLLDRFESLWASLYDS